MKIITRYYLWLYAISKARLLDLFNGRDPYFLFVVGTIYFLNTINIIAILFLYLLLFGAPEKSAFTSFMSIVILYVLPILVGGIPTAILLWKNRYREVSLLYLSTPDEIKKRDKEFGIYMFSSIALLFFIGWLFGLVRQ